MKEKTQKYFSIFLIFLIASTELSQGKSIPKPLQKKLDTLLQQAEELNALQPVVNSRQKRSITTVLFAAGFLVSLANVGLEIFLVVTKCCGAVPDACTYRDKFLEEKDKLNSTSRLVDAKSLAVSNLVTHLSSISLKNEEISLDVKRSVESYENLIQVIDPTVLTKYEVLSAEIEQAVEANNQTVLNWENKDLQMVFDSAFDSTYTSLKALSGVMGPIFSVGLYVAFAYYKTSQIQTLLETRHGKMLRSAQSSKAVRMLSNKNAAGLIKQTANVRFNTMLGTSKAVKIFNFASNIMALVKIGTEIYIAVMKIKQCVDMKNQLKDAYNQIVIDNENLNEWYAVVQELHTNVTSDYNYLLDQLRDSEFLNYLEQIKDLTSFSPSAAANIQKFIDEIPTETNPNKIETLQTDLISSLEITAQTYTCIQKKARTFTQVEIQCKAGEGDLRDLYDSTVVNYETNSDCASKFGVAYTQYADVVAYITDRSLSEGYNSDCVLNHAVKAAHVCATKCSQCTGLICTAAEITKVAELASLTDEDAEKYVALCPTYCPMTPLIYKYACMFSNPPFSFSINVIQSYFPAFNPADIQSYIDSGC